MRSLALAYRITGDEAYLTKARDVLSIWAQDALAGRFPSGGSEHQAGLVIGRIVPLFADGYAMIWEDLSQTERDLMRQWFQHWAIPIERSRDIFENDLTVCDYGVCRTRSDVWVGGNYFSNHLGAMNMGLMAIGYATGDHLLVQKSIKHPDNPHDLEEMINGVIVMPQDVGTGGENGDLCHCDITLTQGAPLPEAGEIWDRNRTAQGNGLHYSYIALRFLTMQADMVANNPGGKDYFAFQGDGGENMELSYEFYSEFLWTGDPSARTGYYSASKVDYPMLPMYEIAHREYPENEEISRILEQSNRVVFDNEMFGYSLLLTDGVGGIPISENQYPWQGNRDWWQLNREWTFDTPGDLEGFTSRAARASLSNGALNLTVNGGDPGVISPGSFVPAAENPIIEIRMRNQTADTSLTLFFTTDRDTVFSGAKSRTTTITANDGDYVTYRLDMRGVPTWKDRIRQIRIDPVAGTSPGTVSIDSIRFLPGTP